MNKINQRIILFVEMKPRINVNDQLRLGFAGGGGISLSQINYHYILKQQYLYYFNAKNLDILLPTDYITDTVAEKSQSYLG